MGCITKYESRFAEEMDKYVDECLESKNIPYKEEFCLKAKITMDNLEDWKRNEEKHPELTNAVKRLEMAQKWKLMKGGVEGKLNPSSSIFQLKANHGMIETERKMIVGGDGNALKIEVIEDTTLKDANEGSTSD